MNLGALLDSLPIPILQAPMVGASLDELAVVVSEAGGMGTLAAGALPPAEIGPMIDAIRARTAAPFGVNLLMAPKTDPAPGEVDAALARLAPWYAELGAPPPETPNQFAPDFEAQFDALVAAAPPVASFTFSILTPAQVKRLQAAGIYVVGTATTVAEARAWAEVGADGICAQGFEAGGHRGHFLGDIEESLVGTLALVATIRAAVDLPVVAAGGIMDGRGVAAGLALGAAAVQMGTAFLLADEAVTSRPWRRAAEVATDDPTRLTRAFTGRHARGIENRFMRLMHGVQDDVPAYPVQNRLTQPMRAAAAKADDPELLSLWAGQAVRLARPGRAGDMIRAWWAEAAEVADAVAARTRRGLERE
ncbi:MAG: nitronate monooxygenase [Phenylobacterium sp.]|uniref:NAD(P)H-dependent flavin oxidoreductase n=1 Tax=Phenylobacterium sp. TaxID=1871053 RepID=UPI001212035C|nr:nitronate monooxygenase [Phenylobacterium sp.]TAJ74719.1 MAG: nitronate monooxygenase [Phenylobacterium sp.]